MTKPAPKEWILGISPYVPGKAAADDGRPLIKLSANEKADLTAFMKAL